MKKKDRPKDIEMNQIKDKDEAPVSSPTNRIMMAMNVSLRKKAIE